MKIYVDSNAKFNYDGSEEHPYSKIGDAAKKARPGDEIIVAPGVYREYVDPCVSGKKGKRIVFRSAVKNAAVITGAEIMKSWKKYEGSVWMLRIPNEYFGDYNPYSTLVFGDWFDASYTAHTGEVFLNGKSLYEVTNLSQVVTPVRYMKSWDSAFSVYAWFTRQDAEKNETVIYANFHEYDPNAETVEITVRRNCFMPSKEGINYITLSGFTVRQAATQWAPPTAFQDGMIGPNWSKGWIIEDCEISHSKCSGISLGKYYQEGNDNKWSLKKFKDGTQTQRDCVCIAAREGWNKENVGSHEIRRCNIHDCGQTGIVGHLGCVFSVIEDNHIHHINNKQNLAGAEIGGIKLHAAIDVIIRRNSFHHCTRGLWLDWQAQGTRVSKNLFYENTLPDPSCISKDNIDIGEDIFIEVSHGPTLVDNNILLSDFALKLPTQGCAFVHNLIAGSITCVGRGVNNGSLSKVSPRYTPYHEPHSTAINGFMSILHGDMRFYNNIFVQKPVRPCMQEIHDALKDDEWTDANLVCGTLPYESYPTEEQFRSMFDGYCGMGSPASDRYYEKLPVWAAGNVYFNGAKPMTREKDAVVDTQAKITLELIEEPGGASIRTDIQDVLRSAGIQSRLITTETLGLAFEPEERFEEPDGIPIIFDSDFYGMKRSFNPIPGPIA